MPLVLMNTRTQTPVGADVSALIYINLRKLLPRLVILSEAKDLVRWAQMLRCTQHDTTLPDCRTEVDAYYRRFMRLWRMFHYPDLILHRIASASMLRTLLRGMIDRTNAQPIKG